MNPGKIRAGVLLLATLGAAGCREAHTADTPESAAPPAESPSSATTVWQLSPLALFARGAYDGLLPVSEVKQHGDHGLGAADQLDGEMALVDGHFYQFLEGGRAVEAPETMRMPFAAVTAWRGGREVRLPPGTEYGAMQAAVEAMAPTDNAFYALRLEGTWDVVMARTYKRQTKPYPPLGEAAADTFVIESVPGTMVGFRQPSYADSLSIPNYHLHFVTADHARGGHVLSFTTRDVRMQVAERPEFTLRMPPVAPDPAP
ncbi:MAG TPA: acetolactate decarboxylase [Longimicrobium sp.]|nr:acetolactate decarboxylase [Longimicrobium sp.]